MAEPGGIAVGFWRDGNLEQTHHAAGTRDAKGNLATVADKSRRKHTVSIKPQGRLVGTLSGLVAFRPKRQPEGPAVPAEFHFLQIERGQRIDHSFCLKRIHVPDHIGCSRLLLPMET